MEVEATIANQDVGFVAPGQEVEVKVETFPYTRYGLIRGTVREVARDSVAEALGDQRAAHGTQSASDDPGAVERSQKLVYMARVELARTRLLADGQVLEVAPGMAVTTEIKTGHRRVLEYLLSPLQGYAHDSLRER